MSLVPGWVEEVADWNWEVVGLPGEQWVLPRQAVDDACPCLLAKAVWFAEPGTRSDLRICGRDGGLEMELENAGAGLSAPEEGRLGEPFFHGQNARELGCQIGDSPRVRAAYPVWRRLVA